MTQEEVVQQIELCKRELDRLRAEYLATTPKPPEIVEVWFLRAAVSFESVDGPRQEVDFVKNDGSAVEFSNLMEARLALDELVSGRETFSLLDDFLADENPTISDVQIWQAKKL